MRKIADRQKLRFLVRSLFVVLGLPIVMLFASSNAFNSLAYGSAEKLSSMTPMANPSQHIVLLVSLGMPDEALKHYIKQSHRYHIPLVIRGLYTAKRDQSIDKHLGSFKDTTSRVFDLLKALNSGKPRIPSKPKGIQALPGLGGISINPLLFRRFSIHTVPALVVVSSGALCLAHSQKNTIEMKCAKSDFDVVYGNLPISKHLKIIAEKSQHPDRVMMVRKILNTYGPKTFSECRS